MDRNIWKGAVKSAAKASKPFFKEKKMLLRISK